MVKPYLTGISGGSASGKTSLVRDLQSLFNQGEITVVSQDHYYHPAELQPLDDKGQINFDLPESLNLDKFYDDLSRLLEGRAVEKLSYNYNNPAETPTMLVFEPAPIVVIEGLFLHTHPEWFTRLDLRIFMEAGESVKLQRRLRRDVSERGLPEDQVRYQWQNHVMPSFDRYLLPYREKADIIIVNNEQYDRSLSVLRNHFKTILEQWKANLPS